MKNDLSRRDFIHKSLIAGIGISGLRSFPTSDMPETPAIKFGLVTYQWGRDWDLVTLIANCEQTNLLGVELRTQHAHGVETSLSAGQRAEVKKRFADSPVTCLGYGSNFEYHSPDQQTLRQNIEQTKEYIKLCRDIGATGIKVKPNTLPSEVPREKTISQIASSLNEIGRFAQDYGQFVRVEVHGEITSEIPVMKDIFDQVSEKNVKICWNSNDIDLAPPGFAKNFEMLKSWIGDTVHMRGFNVDDYPYEDLLSSLAAINFNGWVLLEAHHQVPDRIAAMKEQLSIFNQVITSIKQ